MPVSKQSVLESLRAVIDPDEQQNVVDLGYVAGIVIKDRSVGITLDVGTTQSAEGKEPLRLACQQAVEDLDGVDSATVVLTAERSSDQAPPPTGVSQPDASSETKSSPHSAGKGEGLNAVKAIIAVASGKGGVGKSTVAANLALALSAKGLQVGLLDADIYGPSVPTLFGLDGQPDVVDHMIQPLDAFGIRSMSIGFLVDNAKAMIWRGPMVAGALTQLLNDTAWGALDILVVDMPPGTGDAQLTLAQKVPLAGAVIVSTPQDIALIDARKGIAMFERVGIPVIGLVENMSVFVCPDCGGKSHIFGEGGARQTAEQIGAAFLGEIPLTMKLREASDAGTPVVATEPDSVEAGAFKHIADAVLDHIKSHRGAKSQNQKAEPSYASDR